MSSNRTASIILLSILLLFFLQVFSDFIQSIYAFALLVTALTPHLAAMLLLFSPAILLFVRRVASVQWLMALVGVAVLGRLLEPLLDPGGRLVACGVSVGAFLLLFPLLLAWRIRLPARAVGDAWTAALALLLAVLTSIFFRAAGTTLDISEVGITQIIAWLLAGLAAWLVWNGRAGLDMVDGQVRGTDPVAPNRSHLADQRPSVAEQAPITHDERRAASLRSLEQGPQVAASESARLVLPANRLPAPSSARVAALCIGVASVTGLLYLAWASPAVMARWVADTGDPYAFIVAVIVGAWLVGAGILTRLGRLPRTPIVAWNVLFVLLMALTILPHQISFPPAQEAYPLDAPAVSPLWQIPLYLMLALSPVIVAGFMLLIRGLMQERPTLRQLGGGFAVAALFLLVLVFLHVFTTTYDYTRPIGPLLRDRFWLVYLLAGLGMALPLLSIRGEAFEIGKPESPRGLAAWAALVFGILAVVAVIYPALLRPSAPSRGEVRVMTYNIQQGFDKAGNAALPRQLEAIRRVQPDILGLQESDTARVANGNVDAVRYFANGLGMHSYYGPSTTVGTFGIALLSRYPIQRAWTFYMYSSGEQTACIEAVITANGKTYNVFVTHLGNGGPMVQLIDVMHRTLGLPNVVLMGDFNFDPTTPQYALATQTLADAWLLRWPGGQQIGGGAEGRIDQIFVSPDTRVSEAEYVPDPASDHPYLFAAVN